MVSCNVMSFLCHVMSLLCHVMSLLDGYGDWSTEGCNLSTSQVTNGSAVCLCDHLTSFAILLVSTSI